MRFPNTLLRDPTKVSQQHLCESGVSAGHNLIKCLENQGETGGGMLYVEEEKPLLPGVTAKAATFDKLVQLLVESFNVDGSLVNDSEYPRVLFLMHRWFITSEELAEKLIYLYRCGVSSVTVCTNNCKHRMNDADCQQNRYKSKICHALRYWIRMFPANFGLDSELSKVVQSFQQKIQSEGNSKLKDLVDISKVPSYDWMRVISVRNPSISRRNPSEKVNLVFQQLEPAVLADQLTYLEFKAFRRISFTDFRNYCNTMILKENQKLERSVALFNGLSNWIQCMVLCKTTPQQRADVIIRFLNVAKRLYEIQNYNTLMSVVGGLTHSALARLSKTNACLPSDAQKTLMEFTELLSSSNNFANYRRAICQAKGFRIPILGVHLKDMISLHTALSDKVESDLINFRKMVQLSMIFTELTRLQNASLPFDANMDLVNTLRLCLDLAYTEDEIYELSLAREPRNSVSSPPTPTKPVVFADWLAGVSPPDTETINKHVHDMVEAVFKNYDHDRDGFISHDEFDQVAGNFPFIESFCVLDADQDGLISKAEMKTYFIRANFHALRSHFKHDFHETTYFKPTFCVRCTGLLWGLIKQGWKCKECGINAHKHCRDLVVYECRPKVNAGSSGKGSTNLLVPNGSPPSSHVFKNVTANSKRKMSQRHRRLRSHRSTQTEIFENGSLPGTPKSDRKGSTESTSGGTSSDVEFYEEQATLYERLLEAEETRDRAVRENNDLKSEVKMMSEQITTLKGHVRLIRQHTISFILDQMDTLHIQRDTEV